MTRMCSVCGIEKQLEENFWKRATKNGFFNRCIDCMTKIKKAVRQTPEHKAHERAYRARNRAKVLETKRRYCERNRDKVLEKNRKYREQHGSTRGTTRTAHSIVANAIKSGKLVRPERCQGCLELKPVQAHHDDYDKPLDVQWLCQRCHSRLHARLMEVA